MKHLSLLLWLSCLTGPVLAGFTPPDPASIDDTTQRLMERENVQGLALALIDDGEVQYVAAYGRRGTDADMPLTKSTVMYGASLTKTAFAYLVMQLVDEGRLDLDASIADLLPRPLPAYDSGIYNFSGLDGDDRWRQLTPRILLTHASGLANLRWLEPDGTLKFHFDPGERYAYSGEGFRILQLVLEAGLGIEVGRAMQERVFDRFGLENTAMTWRDDFSDNLSHGFDLEGDPVPHDRRDKVDAAGSMDTTISDQARLWAGFLRGEGLRDETRAEMVSPQRPITSAHQFPTLDTPCKDHGHINLAAGLGLVTFESERERVWFKGGHDTGTGNLLICIEAEKRCLVMLANDVRAERIYPALSKAILGDLNFPWTWEYGWLEQ